MKQKILASKTPLFILFLFLQPVFFLEIVSIAYTVSACLETNWRAFANGLAFILFFSAVLMYSIFYINRAACLICLDEGVVKRKGLFFGFHKECRVEDIRKVVITHFFREGMCICLVDSSPDRFYRIKKGSYICFKKNKANMAFLRSFWDGEVAELSVSNRIDQEYSGK